MSAPNDQHVAAALRSALALEPRQIRRFQTGLCHYVYDVALSDGRQVVVRIADDANRHLLAAGVDWSNLLRPRGVPLPAVLAADFDGGAIPFAFVILERLPGIDLGVAYPRLGLADKRRVAAELVRIQELVSQLPAGSRFGNAITADGASYPTWSAVVEAHLEETLPHLVRLGLQDTPAVERVRARLHALRPHFEQIAPRPFLDDTTTKNVIVDDGRISGIVDVDEICYGDPLLTIGLTQMSLLHAGHDTEYVSAWLAELNRDVADVDERAVARLLSHLERLA